MRKPSVRSVAILVTLCCLAVGVASASSVTNLTKLTISPITPATTVTLTFPFPTAGDAYCSATNGCGTIPSGGQTDFQWTAGDFVLSSIFVVPNSTGATGLTANWSFQDFLGGGNTETWFVLVNGDIGTVTGSVTFGSIGPVAGGYQIELVLQNTVPFGGGSAAWLDGGTTGLTVDIVSTIPEPSSMLLVGTGVIGLAGLMRRKLGL